MSDGGVGGNGIFVSVEQTEGDGLWARVDGNSRKEGSVPLVRVCIGVSGVELDFGNHGGALVDTKVLRILTLCRCETKGEVEIATRDLSDGDSGSVCIFDERQQDGQEADAGGQLHSVDG